MYLPYVTRLIISGGVVADFGIRWQCSHDHVVSTSNATSKTNPLIVAAETNGCFDSKILCRQHAGVLEDAGRYATDYCPISINLSVTCHRRNKV